METVNLPRDESDDNDLIIVEHAPAEATDEGAEPESDADQLDAQAPHDRI